MSKLLRAVERVQREIKEQSSKLLDLRDDILDWVEDIYITYYIRPRDSLMNFWIFRREIWHFRGWDYSYMYMMMIRCMKELEHHIKTHDVRTTSQKDAKNIHKCRKALQRIMEDNYYSVEERKHYKKYPFNLKKLGSTRTPASMRSRTRLFNKQQKAMKDDWKIFSRLFKKSQRWWD